MKQKQMSCLTMEIGSNPYIILFTADVNYNGFYVRETVARFNFYSKSGFTSFQYNEQTGYDVKKDYKSFGAIMNAIFKIYPHLGWTETMVNNAKKAAKQEEKRSIKEAEERYQRYSEEQKQAEETEAIETTNSTINNTTNDNEEEVTSSCTAYNRSFQSYNEAYEYCIASDFDPSYIVTEEPTKASRSLQLDLQLFSNPIDETKNKPFKRPFASYHNGVSKFGIGKHLSLVYTIETTGNDPNLDEINYSNIQQHKRDSIQDALNLFNLYQQHGYYNLQLWVELHYKDQTIIENGTEGQIELMVNNSIIKEAKQIIREYDELKEKVTMYESFLTKYKAKEHFEKHVSEIKANL